MCGLLDRDSSLGVLDIRYMQWNGTKCIDTLLVFALHCGGMYARFLGWHGFE